MLHLNSNRLAMQYLSSLQGNSNDGLEAILTDMERKPRLLAKDEKILQRKEAALMKYKCCECILILQNPTHTLPC
jgi:hypothetical protein